MKNNFLALSVSVILLVASFFAGFSVTKSQAVVPLGFGGQVVTWLPCTCSGSLWIFYAPLKVPSSFPGGPLNYAPYSTLTYSFYNMVTPGVWHLGTYMPGVQGCWIEAGFTCVPLPVLGQEIMVGTSAVPSAS